MTLTTKQIDELLQDTGVTQAVFYSPEEKDFFCNYISSKGYTYSIKEENIRRGTEMNHVYLVKYTKED